MPLSLLFHNFPDRAEALQPAQCPKARPWLALPFAVLTPTPAPEPPLSAWPASQTWPHPCHSALSPELWAAWATRRASDSAENGTRARVGRMRSAPREGSLSSVPLNKEVLVLAPLTEEEAGATGDSGSSGGQSTRLWTVREARTVVLPRQGPWGKGVTTAEAGRLGRLLPSPRGQVGAHVRRRRFQVVHGVGRRRLGLVSCSVCVAHFATLGTAHGESSVLGMYPCPCWASAIYRTPTTGVRRNPGARRTLWLTKIVKLLKQRRWGQRRLSVSPLPSPSPHPAPAPVLPGWAPLPHSPGLET